MPDASDPRRIQTRTDFFAALRALIAPMEACGLSRRAFVENSELPETTWYGYFQGRHLPQTEKALVDALKALKVTDGELVEEWKRALRRARKRGLAVRPPGQLPSDVESFTGREGELQRLLDIIDRSAASPRAASAWVVSGMAGVGKTTLAIHAAHQVADRYPDGQLYLDLRGFSDRSPLLTPGEALDRLLWAVNASGRAPSDVDGRAALWRSELAGRRLLLVLDNAASDEQIRPLLPGTAGSFVLLTARNQFSATSGMSVINLDVLPAPAAVRLFESVAGAERAGTMDPELVEAAVNLCGRLPLAIVLSAGRLQSRPAWTVGYLLTRLRDPRNILGEADGVGKAFSLSYAQLPGDHGRIFRLLGLHPGPDLDVYAAAALAGVAVDKADALLEELVDRHLVEQRIAGRYRLHDLLAMYANGVATETESKAERRAAFRRLGDYYRAVAAKAMDLFAPGEGARRPRITEPAVPLPALADRPEALAWLEAERANLVAVAVHATRLGMPDYTRDLSGILFRYLDACNWTEGAVHLHTAAIEAARDLGDAAAEGTITVSLASAWRQRGDLDRAIEGFLAAADLLRTAADPAGLSSTLINVGITRKRQGRFAEAADYCQRALAMDRDHCDPSGEARSLRHLGMVERSSGQYPEAAAHLEQALQLGVKAGDLIAEARTRDHLGAVYRELGRHAEALAQLRQALHLYEEIHSSAGQSYVLTELAITFRELGQLDEALELHQRSLSLANSGNDPSSYCRTHYEYGTTLRLSGQLEEALVMLLAGADLATRLGQDTEIAAAQAALAEGHRDCGDAQRARQCSRLAATMLAKLGH
jgi:tetratricopeptide (TPR) repeat protein